MRTNLHSTALQDELDRKSIENHDLQVALGDRAPQAQRSTELIDAQKKIRKLQKDLEAAQSTIDDDGREIRRLRDLQKQADVSTRLDELHKALQTEQVCPTLSKSSLQLTIVAILMLLNFLSARSAGSKRCGSR
jgi:glutamine synthetase adenylyltransferase